MMMWEKKINVIFPYGKTTFKTLMTNNKLVWGVASWVGRERHYMDELDP